MAKIAPPTGFIQFTALKTGRKARINCSHLVSAKYIGSRDLFVCSVEVQDGRLLPNGKPLITTRDVAINPDTIESRNDLIRLCRAFQSLNGWVPGLYHWTLSNRPKTLHLRQVSQRQGFFARLFGG